MSIITLGNSSILGTFSLWIQYLFCLVFSEESKADLHVALRSFQKIFICVHLFLSLFSILYLTFYILFVTFMNINFYSLNINYLQLHTMGFFLNHSAYHGFVFTTVYHGFRLCTMSFSSLLYTMGLTLLAPGGGGISPRNQFFAHNDFFYQTHFGKFWLVLAIRQLKIKIFVFKKILKCLYKVM